MTERTSKAKIVALCSTYLGDQWNDAKEEDVTVEHLSQGFGNQNFRCVYKGQKSNARTPLDVVVHIFGCEFLEYDPATKFNGEVGESVIESILCREGLGPKLLGVFPGGRIDEFVPSNTLDHSTAKDPEVFLKLAEKLAKFHSLQIPISKRTNLVQKYLHSLGKITPTETSSEKSSTICDIPLSSEYKWYEDAIKKVSGRPLFTHGDCNPNNILVFESKQGIEKDVLLIDYEMCSYFFRGYDIGYFFEISRYKYERTGGRMRFTRVGSEFSKELKLRFMEKYLEESKKLIGHRFCPVHDSLEQLQLEVELTEVFVLAFTISWTTCLAEQLHADTKDLAQILYPEFVEKKKQAMKSLNLWNLNVNKTCPCTN